MRIHSDYRGNYVQDPVRMLGFSKFENRKDNFIFCIGLGQSFSSGQSKFVLDNRNKKMVILQLEEPNRFVKGENHFEEDKYLHKIFTLCPYTAEWRNKLDKCDKRIPVFFPFNEDFIPKIKNKKYEVIYTGLLTTQRLIRTAKIMKKFRYRLVSNSSFGKIPKFTEKLSIIFSKITSNMGYYLLGKSEVFDNLNYTFSKMLNYFGRAFSSNENDRMITNKGASYEDKLNLIAQSKIAIVHNVFDLNESEIKNIKKIPKIKENEAFENLFSIKPEFLCPQIKSRVFEAAFCRSLILCRKDPWNVIEQFFERDKEFIYYENEAELEQKILEILNNYDKYRPVIDRAFKRAVKEYTTRAFYSKYLAPLDK